MQATATPQATTIQATAAQAARDAQAAAQTADQAAAQAGAGITRERAQSLRDQAQSLRDEARAMRDAARQGGTIAPSDMQLRAMEYEHRRSQQKMEFAGFLVVTLAVVAIFTPIARAFARRVEGKRTEAFKSDDGSRDQLQRMEQAIDAMAIEIERISEGQRFTTKLLSGREEVRLAAGQREAAERVRPN
ncbi:MAG: hypothetical protein ABJE47_12915 [bacterium]